MTTNNEVIKKPRNPYKIAFALNKVKEGSGDYYMLGYTLRRTLEIAASKATK